jgi:hypothetical protein
VPEVAAALTHSTTVSALNCLHESLLLFTAVIASGCRDVCLKYPFFCPFALLLLLRYLCSCLLC